jgi:hypothetical protein
MRHERSTRHSPNALKPLVACLLAALPAAAIMVPARSARAGQAPSPAATTWTVENCDDDGPGSLRDVIGNQAQSGDIVDLGELQCSTITLTSGAIDIGLDDLTLTGPGAANLLIDGGFGAFDYSNYRLIDHSGHGTLEIDGLGLRNQSVIISTPGEAQGGCIRSSGNVRLQQAALDLCNLQGQDQVDGGAIFAEGNVTLVQSSISHSAAICGGGYQSGPTRGGAIYANGDVTLDYSSIDSNKVGLYIPYGHAEGGGVFANGNLTLQSSVVSDNSARAFAPIAYSNIAQGGGIFVHGALTMSDSLVSGNQAQSSANSDARAGGIWSEGPFTIMRSSIVGNSAVVYGGMMALGSGNAQTRIIAESTIAANQSTSAPAGLYAVAALALDNSTVAFNTTTLPAPDHDAGIRALLGIDMQSSLISNNTANGIAADIRAPVTGANNLIQAPGISTVPNDTLVGQDPLLAPPADNGGPTPTVALSPGSPAIDAGNNAGAYAFDQRGAGFARVYGAAADIGAFEVGPALLVVTPETLDFGGIDVGHAGTPMTVTLSNRGGEILTIGQVDTAAAPFAQAGGSCGPLPIVLAMNASCTLEFSFAPTSFGPFEQSIGIDSNAGNAVVDLNGEGLLAILSITPNLTDFGSVAVGSTSPASSVTLHNAGNLTLDVTALDAAMAPFAQSGGSCGAVPIQLGADETCTLDFRFAPVAAGTATQTLSVESSGGNDDFTLLGNGTDGGNDRIFAGGFDP